MIKFNSVIAFFVVCLIVASISMVIFPPKTSDAQSQTLFYFKAIAFFLCLRMKKKYKITPKMLKVKITKKVKINGKFLTSGGTKEANTEKLLFSSFLGSVSKSGIPLATAISEDFLTANAELIPEDFDKLEFKAARVAFI